MTITKTIIPKADSNKAIKAVSTSKKALNKTKNAIADQIEMIKTKMGNELKFQVQSINNSSY